VCVVCTPTDTRGRLVKATRLKGIQDFKASSYGLHPIAVDTWGHFVFLHLQGGAGRAAAQAPAAAASPPSVAEWLGMCQILYCIRGIYHSCLSTPEWQSITAFTLGSKFSTAICPVMSLASRLIEGSLVLIRQSLVDPLEHASTLKVYHSVLVPCAGAGGQQLLEVGMSDSSLVHIRRREYVLGCNWKVFADNYLDGGYHVRTM